MKKQFVFYYYHLRLLDLLVVLELWKLRKYTTQNPKIQNQCLLKWNVIPFGRLYTIKNQSDVCSIGWLLQSGQFYFVGR